MHIHPHPHCTPHLAGLSLHQSLSLSVLLTHTFRSSCRAKVMPPAPHPVVPACFLGGVSPVTPLVHLWSGWWTWFFTLSSLLYQTSVGCLLFGFVVKTMSFAFLFSLIQAAINLHLDWFARKMDFLILVLKKIKVYENLSALPFPRKQVNSIVGRMKIENAIFS